MEENNEKKKYKNQKHENFYIKKHISIQTSFYNRMKQYQDKKGISTFSGLVCRSFEVLEKVFPIEPYESEDKSLFAKIESLEKEIIELRIQKELLQKQVLTITEQQKLVQNEDKKLEENLSEITLKQIPSSKEITKMIFNIFKAFNTNKIKNFILIDELRKNFTDSYIWATLIKLKKSRQLKLENGEWILYKKK